MQRITRTGLFIAWALLLAVSAFGQGQAVRRLPAPRIEGGKPLMEALRERRSGREFAQRKLSEQDLSNLLWAAAGMNRPDGRRTAPSARNWQEIDIYVATAEGLFLFDAKAHVLTRLSTEDLRAATGRQPYVAEAPVNLIYVADLSRMQGSDEEKAQYASADTGFISQNVYLFCASEGLSTVVRGLVDRPRLAEAMKLRADQRIILAQSVGYPRK